MNVIEYARTFIDVFMRASKVKIAIANVYLYKQSRVFEQIEMIAMGGKREVCLSH